MHRRSFLRLGAAALPLTAGCTGAPRFDSGTDQLPERTRSSTDTPTPSTDHATHAWNGPPTLTRRDAPYPQGSVGAYFVAVLRTSDEAAAFGQLALDAGAVEFLSGTEFGDESVVVVQDASGSSHPDLAVYEVRPNGDGVRVGVHYPGRGGTADIIEDNLLVRIAGEPSFARVTVGRGEDSATVATANALSAPPLAEPRPLVVRNLDCAGHRLRIRGRIGGNLVVQQAVETEPGSVTVLDSIFARAASYELDAETATSENDTTASVTFDSDGPAGALVEIGGSAGLSVSECTSVPEERRIDCETGQRPYESSDPAENIDDPVNLWVVSHDPEARTLEVTIRDGETTAFEQTFELQGGKDKARKAGIIAKKGTYALTVALETGEPVETTVEVTESSSKVTVFVEESGAITVRAD